MSNENKQMHEIPLLVPHYTIEQATEALVEEIDVHLQSEIVVPEVADSAPLELAEKRIGQKVLSYLNINNVITAGVGVMNMLGCTSSGLAAVVQQVSPGKRSSPR